MIQTLVFSWWAHPTGGEQEELRGCGVDQQRVWQRFGSKFSTCLILYDSSMCWVNSIQFQPILFGNGAFQSRIGSIVNGRQLAAPHKFGFDDEVESGL
jgi:hypothetical protein